jgi:thiol-disulfide isomerase/thioredoxin
VRENLTRWPSVVCFFVVFSSGLNAQPPSVDGDIKAIRESLRRTNRSGPWFKENAVKRLADWKAAAEKGSTGAIWLLGRCYLDNYGGVDADDEKGISLIRKAAEKGFGLAQNELGYSYQHGDGVEKDLKRAVEWYRKAAEQGEAIGCHNLAACYERGLGVEASTKDAVRWYEKAAEGRHLPAIRWLAAAYESGSGDVKASPAEAVKWYAKLGEAGDPKGTAKVVLMYERGKGVPKDAPEAKKYREKLKEQAGGDADDYVLLVDVLDGATGKKIPEVKGVIDGKPFKLSDQAGKVVVFRFHATWCGPCRAMKPQLDALAKKYDAKSFAVVEVDIDQNPGLLELWEVESVPRVYLLDHTGVIRDRGGDLDKAVADLVAKAAKKDK